jgi:glucose/arabinose dehydrogenase
MNSSPRARSRSASLVALAALAALGPGRTAAAQSLPPDFITQEISGGWTQPTCICFAGTDDLLVTEKAGLLWDVRRGFKHVKPVIDLQQEILNNGDRGLLSVQVDPNWATNGLIYLLYIVDPNQDGNDTEQETFGRLTRYKVYIDINGDMLADPTSRTVLIGATWPEGIPSIHLSHSVGDLRFAVDGSLLLSCGDGAHYDLTDAGGHDPNGFGPGKFDYSEDIGAFRSQSFTSLAGKILRVDPATGNGLPDNPFWTGTATDNQSRIWAMGLRNPFRFCIKPGSGSPGRLFIGDVGWNTWEEVNSCFGSEDFGWPCTEGPKGNIPYINADPNGYCTNYTQFTKPMVTYNHSDPTWAGYIGNCTAGVCYYTGSNYPQIYNGRLFFADYAADWIRSLIFVNGKATTSELFGTTFGNPVDLIPDPVNGDLYYIGITPGTIRRIIYTKSNKPPVALATITPVYGPSPLTVSLDASASYDPEGQPLTYDWDLGDGTHSSQAVLTNTYPNSQNYTVVLTVTDPSGEYGTLSQVISVDNTPPVITAINTPAPGSFYTGGQAINFSASATDAEDDPLFIPLTYKWVIDLIADDDTHPAWVTLFGATASWVPTHNEEATYLHVTLTVSDSRGMTATSAFDLYDQQNEPQPTLENVSNLTPRVGHEISATGHLFWPGFGAAELEFDWGDGSIDVYTVMSGKSRTPKHTYIGPGYYTLRLTARNRVSSDTTMQSIYVRPLAPAVAIFAPLVSQHFIKTDDQWTIATELANDIHTLGFEANLYGPGDQAALQAWMTEYFNDSPRDYLVCLDAGPSVAYAGEDDKSLAEHWLDSGNGILWTGYNPFARYIRTDEVDDNAGSGPYAADEVLDAAIPQICSGSARMLLTPDAGDIPSLAPFNAGRAVLTANLNSTWSISKIYASDKKTPPMSDALVCRNTAGGEYAQFYCLKDSTIPREAVLSEFFKSHVFVDLPPGPDSFALLTPGNQTEVPQRPTLTWELKYGTTSWLVEIAGDAEFTKPLYTATVTGAPTVTVGQDLPFGRHCFWRVTARNDYGTVVSSTRSFVVTTSGQPPTLGHH